MSLQLEEENSFSQSDSKMDISDATTSPESPQSKPTTKQTQQQQQQQNQQDNQNLTTKEKEKTENIETLSNINNATNQTEMLNATGKNINNEMVQHIATKPLDNRIILPPLNFNSSQQQQQNHQHQQQRPIIIARTLANSHPLMSPGTDSDSEHSREQSFVFGGRQNREKLNSQQIQHQSNQPLNFPDVVPASEHHNHHHHLNAINNKTAGTTQTPPQHSQVAILRTHSLDLISSESEADVSQYRATVETNLQTVALTSSNHQNTNTTNVRANNTTSSNRKQRARKNGCDDISSLDSISNHSFDDDEDIEHNLASLSPSISITDGLDDYDDDDDDDDDDEGPDIFDANVDDDDDDELNNGLNAISLASKNTLINAQHELMPAAAACAKSLTSLTGAATTASTAAAADDDDGALPQYSLADERRNSRNWQKVTLPDGRLFEIDMRVIEPYKRVLSHGGYLNAGGHNAIVIFCACHLPDRSRADYNYVMDNLFLYVVKTLEQLVTDDYVLIYLHGGCNRRNVPPFPWLKKCYQLLDRRLRKSLKNMYLVHPTFWVKSIVWMARPFVSVKFWRKLVYVKSLEELKKYVAVEKAAIPEKVKQYDAKHN